jgi:hypothetical protein
LRRERGKEAMHRRLAILIATISILVAMSSVLVGLASATSASIQLYLPDGTLYESPDDMGSNPVPLGTTFTIKTTYTGVSSVKYSLTVWYSTTQDGTYHKIDTLANNENILNGQTLEHTYEVASPGWYIFQFEAGKSIKDSASANASAGPVLSEPATIAALGLCFAAVGIILFRKKPVKTSI